MFIMVDEITTNRADSCWQSYTAAAVDSRAALVIALTELPAASLPPGEVCAGGALGPYYVRVELPSNYRGQPVIDKATGLRKRVGAAVKPTKSQIVNPA